MFTTQKLIIGDNRESLKKIPNDSIDCVVTSPPYWGLRDYKVEPIIWDGAPGCEHEWGSIVKGKEYGRHDANDPSSTNFGGYSKMENSTGNDAGCYCQKCGAWKGQIGLEPDPNLYIQHLCGIFDEVKRVLKPSGTCWVNLGDSYSSDKCLVQIPSRFALEMTARGWILRNEIIWHKPNCMPSSVTDRFTVDFEKVFFFVKSKKYYFKQQLEPVKEVSLQRAAYGWDCDRANNGVNGPAGIHAEKMGSRFVNPNGRNKRTVWTITTKPYSGSHFAVFPLDLIAPMIDAGCPADGTVMDIFSGSGTVLEYCRNHDLNGIGLELNPEYEKLAVDRAMLNMPNIMQYSEEGTTENDI